MITTLGWRTSCLIWAWVIAVIVPFIWVTIKQKRPEYYGLLPDGAKAQENTTSEQFPVVEDGSSIGVDFEDREHTLRQAMKTLAYWMLIAADASGMIVFSGFTIHCIPFITDLGIDPTIAGSLMAMMIVFTIPSTGIASFLLYPHPSMLYPLLILMGFGTGAVRPLLIIIRGRYFGRKAYGSIEGTSMTFQTPFSILSPVYAGWVYDTTGSYMTAFILFASLAAFSTLVMYMARYPKNKVNGEQ
jgi:cyanate permease